MYEYKAHCVNVVDGDTFDFIVDLGFSITYKIRVRLKDKDTPEKNSKNAAERVHAKEATVFVEENTLGQTVVLKTEKDKIGIYGRYTAAVTLKDGRDLGELLEDNNMLKRASYPENEDEST